MQDTPTATYTDRISDWWSALPAEKKTTYRVDQIASLVFGMTPDRISMITLASVGKALKALGFRRKQRRILGRQTWLYFPPGVDF